MTDDLWKHMSVPYRAFPEDLEVGEVSLNFRHFLYTSLSLHVDGQRWSSVGVKTLRLERLIIWSGTE